MSRGKIKTLRLLNFDDNCCFDVLNNKNVIQSLNLLKSCKNLLVQIDLTDVSLRDNSCKMEKVIKSIFQKECYYNLDNVNLLLELNHCHIDWIFALLKRDVKILKHQFKQLNIGITIYYW